jgi:hypothetical protein
LDKAGEEGPPKGLDSDVMKEGVTCIGVRGRAVDWKKANEQGKV